MKPGNRNGYGQTAEQVQRQTQVLTPQQVLTSSLIELPIEGLVERVNKEIEDNVWLESQSRDADSSSTVEVAPQERSTDTDSYDDDGDSVPVARSFSDEGNQREQADNQESFFDHLESQIQEYDVDEHEEQVLRYLIGSLDDDGLLRTSLYQLADQLDVYQNMETCEAELRHLLTTVLQQMEPAGVGARNLQECLLLQARRNYTGEKQRILTEALEKHWDDITSKNWQHLGKKMKLDDMQVDQLVHSLQRLNPKPGSSIGSDCNERSATVVPDFRVEIDDQHHIHLTLNETDLPRLSVSDDAEEQLAMPLVTKQDRESMRYIRDKVNSAQLFITAMESRRRTMISTMRQIIRRQRRFFLEGDDTLLVPMSLTEVGQDCGLDVSTVSRVCNNKYVETPYGIYSLRHFFTTAAVQNGQEVSVRKIQQAIQTLVEQEDRRHPLSDETLVRMLGEQGYTVARRTVAKYRNILHIADSRLRRES